MPVFKQFNQKYLDLFLKLMPLIEFQTRLYYDRLIPLIYVIYIDLASLVKLNSFRFRIKLVTLSVFLVIFLKVVKLFAIAVKLAYGNPQN